MILFSSQRDRKTDRHVTQTDVTISQSHSRQCHTDQMSSKTSLSPLSSSSFAYPSSSQEEACFHTAQHSGDDAASGASGDPQHCQRFWMQQCTHVPGPRPLLRHPHHLRGTLHQPGLPPARHDHLQLVLWAPPEAKPPGKWQEQHASTHWEHGGHEQTSEGRLAVGVCVRRAVTDAVKTPMRCTCTLTKDCTRCCYQPFKRNMTLRYCSYCTHSLTFLHFRMCILNRNVKTDSAS